MAFDPQKARVASQLLRQGLSDEQALRQAGVSPADFDFYSINDVPGSANRGNFEPITAGPGVRPNDIIVPASAPPPPPVRTTTVSQQSTTTDQTTVTGGAVTTTRVTPTTYADTPESQRLSAEAAARQAELDQRSAQLRAQGLTGAQILRDPEARRLAQERDALKGQAQDARAVSQAGTVSVTTTPGPAVTVSSRTPDGATLTGSGADQDAQVALQQANSVSSSGVAVENRDAAAVTNPDGPGQGFVFDPNTGELVPGDSVQAREILAEQQRVQPQAAVPGVFSAAFDPEGTAPNNFAVWDNSRGVFVARGLSESEAQRRANEFNAGAADLEVSGAEQVQQAQDAAAANEAAANEAATRERARVQATLANQLRQADSGDWRFKIRLAPGARYLYRGDDGQGRGAGILAPLAVTDGVIFPYTPTINTQYQAGYAEQALPHSNYKGYFYSGSSVASVQVEAVFTAQDTTEANYMLAVIHFFRSVTKMFYGQDDAFRGAPPPLVFLQGFGAYQFSRQPCVVSSFQYNLPADVDYIRADVQPITGLNIQQGRRPGGVPPQSLPTNVFTGALERLQNAGATKGAIFRPAAAAALGTTAPTYVPTKISMSIELLPMQTRQQVSQEFNMRDFASGSLVRKGFW